MKLSKKSLALTVAASLTLAATGSVAVKPALARDLAGTIAAIVTCSSTSPCAQWNNTGTGNAVQVSSTGGNGLVGYTSAAARSGVYGGSQSSGGGYGVHGANTSANGFAVYGLGGSGVGVWANAFGAKPALLSNATSGHAADIFSSSGIGAVISAGGNSNNNVTHVLSEGVKPGLIVGGGDIGAILTAGLNGTPLLIQGISGSGGGEVTIDSVGNINTTGDIIYGGSLIGPTMTRSGVAVTSYATRTTQSNVEDSGTAQLVGGAAVVRLDPAYAQTIDLQTPYRVFLTPNADSRGLYVAQKTATAFIVREMQGGHGTFAFDFRVLGTALGHTGDRMTALTPALRAQMVNHKH